jgi:plastocyanin
MKTSIVLFILVLLLVAASGCTTQQAKPAATATTLTTTVVTTEVPTVINTPVPTTVSTPVAVPTTAAMVTAAPTPSTTPAFSKTNIIHIRNNTFVPAELTALPGTGIIWVNDDSVTHIVKASGDAKGKFTSSDLVSGAQFGYTFGEVPGTYEFMDPNYPDMKGTIIIRKGDVLWIATGTPVKTP